VLGGGDAGVGPRQAKCAVANNAEGSAARLRGEIGGKPTGFHAGPCMSPVMVIPNHRNYIYATIIAVVYDSESRDWRSHFPSPHSTGRFRNRRKDRRHFRFCRGAWHYNRHYDQVGETRIPVRGHGHRFSMAAMSTCDPFFAISASGFPLLLLISLLLLQLRRGCVNC
jgi:hypothetical protein